MMHYQDTVVTLVDDNKKPLREYNSQQQNNGRKCEVFIPFDTQYKFLIKNNNSSRIRVEIDIDGSNVTKNGLILDKNCTDYIERFVDIDKKFKFVKATNENVSDPSSPENGIVKVRIHKEKINYCTITTNTPPYYKCEPCWQPYWQPYWPYNGDYYGGSFNGPIHHYGYDVTSMLRSCDNEGSGIQSSNHVFANQIVGVSMDSNISENGATIEGGHSNQSFGLTTWKGDEGVPSVFTFYLKAAKIDPEYQKYLELKSKFEKS